MGIWDGKVCVVLSVSLFPSIQKFRFNFKYTVTNYTHIYQVVSEFYRRSENCARNNENNIVFNIVQQFLFVISSADWPNYGAKKESSII